MVVKNATIYDESCGFQVGDIYIEQELITDGISKDQIEIDASGLYAVPGLIDLHLHGCNGYDFCDGSTIAFEQMALYEAQNGVTTICPATMTLDEDEFASILRAFSSYRGDLGAEICGIYMEGPYISQYKKGAQNSTYIRKPDVSMFRKLQAISGNKIKVVTVAPEVEGAIEFIEKLNDEVTISIAHTEADYAQSLMALQAGAKQITHLYNAMPPLNHREPGVIGAALDMTDCYVELICDGVHIHPSVIRATLKMFHDRVILISDSMMAAGLSDGIYSLGKQEVRVSGKIASLTKTNAIAGSVSNLMDCVRYLVKEVGIPLEKAIQYASVNPAKALGIYPQCGSITPGKNANIVLLDQELKIKMVILRGNQLSK